MVKPWLVGFVALLLVGCSSSATSIPCRQPNVPVLTLVSVQKLVPVGDSQIYAISVVNQTGDPMPVFSDPELANVLDRRVPPCSTFIVSEETTNYAGVRVAHVLRVIEWAGKRYAYWGLSGYLPRGYLTAALLTN